MKKNMYVLIGVGALLVSLFMLATMFYKQSSETAPVQNGPELAEMRAKLMGDADRTLGPSTARVVVVEFLDPECESCRLMHPITKKMLADFPGQIHYVLRYMPFHGNSVYASSALEAAARQGKFWEALDVVFEKQPEWGSHQNPQPQLLMGYLKDLGLDMARLEADMKDPAIAARIEKDKSDGLALGVRGTPTFYINGQMLQDLGEGPLRSSIQQALAAP
jgi:protein-disulfide isomerase